MREYFVNEYPKIPFNMFEIPHLITILLTILGLAFIYYYRFKIKQIPSKTKTIIRISIVIIMFLNMIVYYNGYAYYGIYDWKDNLPLHLCFLSGFAYMFALFTENSKIYRITYFFAFIGPIPAIIWPSVTNIDCFEFLQFVISHHFFLLSSMFIYYAYDIRIGKKDMIKTFLLANCLFLFMALFNHIFGTNYIMSKTFPDTFLKQYPIAEKIKFPIVLLETAGILMLFLSYIPLYLRKKERF